jgi:hypothetical protein
LGERVAMDPDGPQKMEVDVCLEEFKEERKNNREMQKQSLQVSLRSVVKTFENVQRDYKDFLDNDRDHENTEESQRVLKRVASDMLVFFSYYSRRLQFELLKAQ